MGTQRAGALGSATFGSATLESATLEPQRARAGARNDARHVGGERCGGAREEERREHGVREVGGVMGERFRSVATTGYAAPDLVWQVARDGTRDSLWTGIWKKNVGPM